MILKMASLNVLILVALYLYFFMATNSKLCQIQVFQKGRVAILHNKNPLVDHVHSEKLYFGHYQGRIGPAAPPPLRAVGPRLNHAFFMNLYAVEHI